MPRVTKAPVDPDDAPLKRLGGGRWQTRDERFTIEPQSGTWAVVDAEQTDDFGMPLVRGPYPSLTAAKEAISGARSSEPATSPLTERIERRRAAPAVEADATKAATPKRSPAAASADDDDGAANATKPEAPSRSKRPATTGSAAEAPSEPDWVGDLAAGERGRARKLIATLTADGVTDAEGLVRRDLAGDVPALAAHAIARRLAELEDDAAPTAVAELLADGRDETLGVRWRLVDGDGRPILLESSRRRR